MKTPREAFAALKTEPGWKAVQWKEEDVTAPAVKDVIRQTLANIGVNAKDEPGNEKNMGAVGAALMVGFEAGRLFEYGVLPPEPPEGGILLPISQEGAEDPEAFMMIIMAEIQAEVLIIGAVGILGYDRCIEVIREAKRSKDAGRKPVPTLQKVASLAYARIQSIKDNVEELERLWNKQARGQRKGKK